MAAKRLRDLRGEHVRHGPGSSRSQLPALLIELPPAKVLLGAGAKAVSAGRLACSASRPGSHPVRARGHPLFALHLRLLASRARQRRREWQGRSSNRLRQGSSCTSPDTAHLTHIDSSRARSCARRSTKSRRSFRAAS